MDTRVNLLGLPPPELEAWVQAAGSRPFRARQLQHWLYKRGVARLRGDDGPGQGFPRAARAHEPK